MKEYTADDIKAQIKPLSGNAFIRFFQKIWRNWLSVWYGFSDKKPTLAAWIYKLGFFVLFSMSVTIYQYIVMTFLPYAFSSLNSGAAGWPGIEIGKTGQQYIIFGDTQGWGYFIAFEIAVFTAQCINFPLQRNITYHSHGNPWWQAMWYFIGWVLVSVFTNALWGICNVYLVYWGWPDAVTGLLKTVLTGGVSLVIFFFIFLVIFPDNNAAAKRAQAKLEKLTSRNAPEEKIKDARSKAETALKKAELSNAEKEYIKARSQASSAAMKYFALVKASEEADDGQKDAALPEKIEKSFAEAIEAVKTKEEKEAAFNAAKAA